MQVCLSIRSKAWIAARIWLLREIICVGYRHMERTAEQAGGLRSGTRFSLSLHSLDLPWAVQGGSVSKAVKRSRLMHAGLKCRVMAGQGNSNQIDTYELASYTLTTSPAGVIGC